LYQFSCPDVLEFVYDNGFTLISLANKLCGYATTSHKSQGATCDHAILAATQMSNRACYVGSSRGRQSVKVFTPDFEHLYDSVKRNSEHLTGHDLIAAREEYMNVFPKQEAESIQEKEMKIDYHQEIGISM
jgi:ATP-dependent exoDNAse (exonuclease V) alpha subunit